MWEEIKTTDFSFFTWVRNVCVCVCTCFCVAKIPPMQLLTAAVWLMDRLFFAEGCWLHDVLTKIWLAKPKAYFITHKTFHVPALCFTERPSLIAVCGWISCLWVTLPALHLLCWYSHVDCKATVLLNMCSLKTILCLNAYVEDQLTG